MTWAEGRCLTIWATQVPPWATSYWALNYCLQRVLAPSTDSSAMKIVQWSHEFKLHNVEEKWCHFEISYVNHTRLHYTLNRGIQLQFFSWIYLNSFILHLIGQYFSRKSLSQFTQWAWTEWWPYSRHRAGCCDSGTGVYLDSQKKIHR